MDRLFRLMGLCPFVVILAFFRWVFMLMSTPVRASAGAAVSLCGKCVVCCVPAVWAWRFVRVWMGGRVCERGEHGCRGVRADGAQ